jgi:superfamily I DNA/RNA helicase
LATCHAVKGLEFSSVWVAGVEDDLFPHSKADSEEEENRLLYVACTRAKDLLAVSWCRMRRSWGKIKQSQPSRFLEAIGASDE